MCVMINNKIVIVYRFMENFVRGEREQDGENNSNTTKQEGEFILMTVLNNACPVDN